jgi:phosphoserine aminotransferase
MEENSMRVHNFNAGPAVLPEEVLKEVQDNLLDYKGNGLSVMEMSHRSVEYGEIIEGAKAAMKRIMGLGDDYEALFLHGGASTQFLMIPLNFCPDDRVANYINTGAWATKALKEAKKIGKQMHVAASSEDKDFTYIPKIWHLSENPAYLHITTNNTIRGTEWNLWWCSEKYRTGRSGICCYSKKFNGKAKQRTSYYAGLQYTYRQRFHVQYTTSFQHLCGGGST